MLSNLLKLPIFRRSSIIDKMLVIFFGILTNLIGLTRHISRIKSEQYKVQTGMKTVNTEFENEINIENLTPQGSAKRLVDSDSLDDLSCVLWHLFLVLARFCDPFLHWRFCY